jgi:hypothetical protein
MKTNAHLVGAGENEPAQSHLDVLLRLARSRQGRWAEVPGILRVVIRIPDVTSGRSIRDLATLRDAADGAGVLIDEVEGVDRVRGVVRAEGVAVRRRAAGRARQRVLVTRGLEDLGVDPEALLWGGWIDQANFVLRVLCQSGGSQLDGERRTLGPHSCAAGPHCMSPKQPLGIEGSLLPTM